MAHDCMLWSTKTVKGHTIPGITPPSPPRIHLDGYNSGALTYAEYDVPLGQLATWQVFKGLATPAPVVTEGTMSRHGRTRSS